MSIVLVHGNPETEAVWDELRAQLGRDDVVALSPPGFGAPVPAGFDATSDGYLAWLVEQLQTMRGPIDLVGHDWGGAHVLRLACTRPDLVRSWVTDVAGVFDPEYVWHEFAQVLQTPGAGEEAVAATVAAPAAEFMARLEGAGVSTRAAQAMAAATDEDWAQCALTLYRSAAQPALSRWGEALPAAAARPGLVIVPTEDHLVGGEALARRSAERAGAAVAVLEGLGHWWMCEDPGRGAAALRDFYEALRRAS